MNPGIYYLYEYKNNHRMRNTGFLKLTPKPDFWLLQIQSRNIPVTQKQQVKLFVISNKDDNIIEKGTVSKSQSSVHSTSKKISELPCNHHAISARLTIPYAGQESAPDVHDLHGFLIELPNGNWLAATEAQFHLNINEIVNLNVLEPSINTSENNPSAPGTEIPENDITSLPTEDLENNTSTISASEYTEQAQENTMSSTEPVDSESYVDSDRQNFSSSAKTIRKIQRSDLKVLPRKCWNLANNSFLLHGYHNYHHLLLIEENGHYQLGVPGVYDIREARAAEIFGFPQFIDTYNDQMELSASECNTQEKFGYWCHYIY